MIPSTPTDFSLATALFELMSSPGPGRSSQRLVVIQDLFFGFQKLKKKNRITPCEELQAEILDEFHQVRSFEEVFRVNVDLGRSSQRLVMLQNQFFGFQKFKKKTPNYPPEIEDLGRVHGSLGADRSGVLEGLVAFGLALGQKQNRVLVLFQLQQNADVRVEGGQNDSPVFCVLYQRAQDDVDELVFRKLPIVGSCGE